MKTLLAVLLILAATCQYQAYAQSQKFYCTNKAQIAERMIRDMTTTDIKPQHYATEAERDLAVQAIHCAERGENVTACIVRRCMEEQS